MNEEQITTPEELELEEQVLNAIMGDGTIQLEIEIGPQGRERTLSLDFRWPTAADEQLLDVVTARFCNGLPQDVISDAGYELARARALIEILTVGPYEGNEWLPPTEKPVEHQGKRQLRPDTSKVKSRGILVAFGRKWYETYTRFQYLAAGE